ncbi:hypothetical protein [Natrinema marinum]|uniref:hypothetical protein n=1 Tax=Natrinema marinum TaxID=2961598 RepID=UPI0020C885C9|nr:hypothetical protein [Natrinema marinum]
MLTEIGIAVLAGFFGALVKDFIVRPLRGYRQVRKKIAKDLIKYSHLISSPGAGKKSRIDEARYELRDDAAELRAVMEDLPGYVLWSLFWVPAPSTLERVEGHLIRLSNSVHSGDPIRNDEDREKVKELLNIGG